MKNWFFMFGAFFVFANSALAIEIVYPKTPYSKVSASSSFFIGNIGEKTSLLINGSPVKVHQKGIFAYFVPLNVGVNSFNLESGNSVLEYKIEREDLPISKPQLAGLVEYSKAYLFQVKNDGAPLRSSPEDYGINRIAQLPLSTNLTINAETKDFYRVVLSKGIYGWISKIDLEPCSEQNSLSAASYNGFLVYDEPGFMLYKFNLSSRVPYSISDYKGLHFKIYNLENFENLPFTVDFCQNKFFGYEVYYENNNLFLKVKRAPVINKNQPLKSISVVVDPGHGGVENGAIGCGGMKEKDFNLAVSKFLKDELNSRGANVATTRIDDISLPLFYRIEAAKSNKADVLLSIHSNAVSDGQDPLKHSGISVYYYHNQSKALAECIKNELVSQLKMNDDKVRQKSLAMIRPTFAVCVLIEIGYMINPKDYELLTNQEFQKKAAKAIADGVEKYLEYEFTRD